MISALHLLWIVPLSATFGFVVAAIFIGGKLDDNS
jgi:hypothetical protein